LDEALPKLDVPVERIVTRLGALGISPDKMIVIYDEIGGQRAAQAFWLMEYLGFERVALLEGGSERWMAEGHTETSTLPNFEPSYFVANVRAERIATAAWIAERLNDLQLVLVDCRAPAEYGEGHLPGARNRAWDKTLEMRSHQQFRDADALTREFAELGAVDGREIVTYCGTGRRSAHTYFTLRLLGYPAVRNYKGSWDEWQTRPDLPKEK
jgi:thiosulfate/3-mercaptopyruvate sulfurtransferase